MKKRIRLIQNFINSTAILVVLSLIAVNFTVFASADSSFADKSVGVIVKLEESADIDLVCAICEKAVPGLDIERRYSRVFSGFYATLPQSSVPKLKAIDKVMDVSLSGSYTTLSSYSGDGSMAAAYMVGYQAALDAGLTGDGVVVAVIDDGFDITHPAFEKTDITETIKKSDIESLIAENSLTIASNGYGADDIYYSAKIPFRFDYSENGCDVYNPAGHGVHVAGIIAANPTEESNMQGIAPDCQLLIMKIFNSIGNADEHDILSAIEDSVALGADVINLSLGSYSGSSGGSKSAIDMEQVLRKAEEAGCIVVCAAGNEAISTGFNSMPNADYTDYGTMSFPASMPSTIAVAAVNSNISYLTHFKLTDTGEPIEYSDTNVTCEVLNAGFSSYFDGQTLEYVNVPGNGSADDFKGLDLSGKIALVERGTITFLEKAQNSAAAGAVAMIVYNNTDEQKLFNMDITDSPIPAIAISREDGKRLISASRRLVSFGKNMTVVENADEAKRIAFYSSAGPTPSLNLKPDISGVGGDVLSTFVDGTYTVLSGTSMAAPQISGISALMIQKLRESGTAKESMPKIIPNKLMNSADPVFQENSVEYSPRFQGAGLVSIPKALTPSVEITDSGTGKAKTELFEIKDNCAVFSIDIKNSSDKTLDVRLGMTVTHDKSKKKLENMNTVFYSTTEAAADRYAIITADRNDRNLNRYSDDYSPLTVTLNPGETRSLTLRLTLDSDYSKFLSGIFRNGFYTEGFIYAETELGDSSIPYMGYCGDWTSAPVLDSPAGSGTAKVIDGTSIYLRIDGELTDAAASGRVIAFSPNGDKKADNIYLFARLLRNSKSFGVYVLDSDGKVVYTDMDYNSYTRKTSGTFDVNTAYGWDGSDGFNDSYILPDGMYRFVISTELDFGDNLVNTVEYDVFLDTEKPALKSLSFDDRSKILTIKASDNYRIREIKLYSPDNGGKTIIQSFDEEAEADLCTALFDMSGLTGAKVYYEITDSAYNTTVGILPKIG